MQTGARTLVAAGLAGVLLLAGCGTSQVITSLELAIDAVAAALPLIGPAAGLPADLTAQLEGYLGATSTAVSQASDILAGPGTDEQKAAQIVAAFAGIAVPIVPAKYQGIATAIQQVAQMVAKFLATLPSPALVSARAAGVTEHTTVFSEGDLRRLAEVKTKAAAARAKISH